ncbi:MAG TPA: hypothetical protein VMV86_04720 [Methanosarcinales archaeon]|nr:hypothetical protein [Methanosarcinales archaeon]
MKFFIWLIEFKIKRKENKDKLRYLIEKLIEELELQGNNLNGSTGGTMKFLAIFEQKDDFSLESNSMKTIRIEKQVNEHGR